MKCLVQHARVVSYIVYGESYEIFNQNSDPVWDFIKLKSDFNSWGKGHLGRLIVSQYCDMNSYKPRNFFFSALHDLETCVCVCV